MTYECVIFPKESDTYMFYEQNFLHAVQVLRNYLYPMTGLYEIKEILNEKKTVKLNQYLYNCLCKCTELCVHLVRQTDEDPPEITAHLQWYYNLPARDKTMVQRLFEDWFDRKTQINENNKD